MVWVGGLMLKALLAQPPPLHPSTPPPVHPSTPPPLHPSAPLPLLYTPLRAPDFLLLCLQPKLKLKLKLEL